MEAKELKKLRREELLEMLIQEKRENDELREELRRVTEEKDREIELLKKHLADRRIRVSEAGTMAEAALAVYRVFERADQAATLYLDSVKALAEKQRCEIEQQRAVRQPGKEQQTEKCAQGRPQAEGEYFG